MEAPARDPSIAISQAGDGAFRFDAAADVARGLPHWSSARACPATPC
jgi:hypothetical protein